MAPETFTERLARLIRQAGFSDADLASILGMTEMQARRLRDGTTKSLKLEPALRLCKRLGVSPWELAGEPEPSEGRVSPLLFEQSPDRLRALEERVDLLTARLQQVADSAASAAEHAKAAQDSVARLRSNGKEPREM